MAAILEKALGAVSGLSPSEKLRKINAEIEDHKYPEPITRETIDGIIIAINKLAENHAKPGYYSSFRFPSEFSQEDARIFARYWRQKLREVKSQLKPGFQGVSLEDRVMYQLEENSRSTGNTTLFRSKGLIVEIASFKREWPDLISWSLFEHSPGETSATKTLVIPFNQGRFLRGIIFIQSYNNQCSQL